jgi:hypothetical protein
MDQIKIVGMHAGSELSRMIDARIADAEKAVSYLMFFSDMSYIHPLMGSHILYLATKLPVTAMDQKAVHENIPLRSRAYDGVPFIQGLGLVVHALVYDRNPLDLPSGLTVSKGSSSDDDEPLPPQIEVLTPFMPVVLLKNGWGGKNWNEVVDAFPMEDTAADTYILGMFQGPKDGLKFVVGPPLSAIDKIGADKDCKSGPIHILLARYDFKDDVRSVEIFWERLDFVFNNYWIDPWNQGLWSACVVLCYGFRSNQFNIRPRKETQYANDYSSIHRSSERRQALR